MPFDPGAFDPGAFGGSPPSNITTRSKFWGPMFPDVWAAGFRHWGPHFPDPGLELDLVTPTGPAGVATFVLDLDANMDVTHEWQTDIFKSYDGREKRASILDYPRRRIVGSALLIGGASVRTLRSQLARHAASGATFRLGLPFEGLLLAEDAIGTTVNVSSISESDWINPGQRVVVMAPNRTAVDAVIQSASGGAIVLDTAPGAIGKAGGVIMPTIAIYLNPQQGFARYRNAEGFERWSIDAVAADFGWQKAAVHAQLSGLETGAGNFDDVVFQALVAGPGGNLISVEVSDDSLSDIDFAEVGNAIHIKFVPGVSTMGELVAAVNAGSTLIKIIGSWNPSNVLQATDTFTALPLTGGSDGDYVDEGAGAVVSTHDTRPVFDRSILVSDTGAESLQAMNEVVDLGGLPANVGQAAIADWGRHVAIRKKWGIEWQWWKKFLATVRGRQRAFWLPTWRKDLDATASGVGTLTIEGPSDGDGGFFTWYPTKNAIQIVQADGTITRATITNAVDNGDGTITLTTGVTLSGSAITMVSWLELCRFEDDAQLVRFANHMFEIATPPRYMSHGIDGGVNDFAGNDAGVEVSQPREGYEFILPAVTHRLTSAVKDVVIDGQTYRAGTIQRAEAVPSVIASGASELEVSLLVTHALPQRYLRGGIPPRSIVVNVKRKQLLSGESESVWSGVVVGMAVDRHIAKFLIAQSASESTPRRIPTVSVGRECAHVLYDDGCALDRDDFKVETTVAGVDGREVTLASVGGNPDQWAKHGELLHVASGEKMTVVSQIGTTITIQLPLVDLQFGDAVELYAGCDHSTATCFDKFANHYNFGNYPRLLRRNPFVKNGLGMVEQE